jgi:glycosyltransferase involved in cell wall biosynthesis
VHGRPLVSVLTPVYNGAAYLPACLDSVLAQTYADWEYIVVDNASTDATPAILRDYAAREPRLRVCRNDRTVGVIDNHNVAAGQISSRSRWCKYVAADDMLLPECLERMVATAQAHPSIGLVSAYQVCGDRVTLTGLPYPSPVSDGRHVARSSLLGLLCVFGSPTAHMIRADLVRGRARLYDPANLHADEAACYEVLRTSDFGFVHQVLSYAREHRESLTVSVARRLNTYVLGHLRILLTYGPVYLGPREYRHVLAERLDVYYRFLARALLSPEREAIWRYHAGGLRALGLPVSRRRLVRAMLQELGRAARQPGTSLRQLVRLARSRTDDELGWRQWWAPTGFEAVKSVPAPDQRAA